MKKLTTAWLALLLGFAAASLHADEKYPAAVRYAAVSTFLNGKPVFTGLPAVIEEQGWLEAELKKRGVKLEWFPAPNANVAATINEGFANGSVDFAGYGDLPSIILNAGGVDTRLIVPNGWGTDTFLVVPKNSTARSIADLKGKRIAIHRGRPWEVPLIRLMESQGLSYKDFRILNINQEAGAAALAAGSIDAIYTLTDAYLLEDRQVGHIIWSTKDAPADWKMRAELWASKRFIDRYPELAQLVATAQIRAAHWASQPENVGAMIKLMTRAGTPESVVRREYDDDRTPWKQRWSPNFGDYVYAHYEHTVAFAADKKLIRSSFDSRRLFDTRFVNPALQALQLEHYWDDVAKVAVSGTAPVNAQASGRQ